MVFWCEVSCGVIIAGFWIHHNRVYPTQRESFLRYGFSQAENSPMHPDFEARLWETRGEPYRSNGMYLYKTFLQQGSIAGHFATDTWWTIFEKQILLKSAFSAVESPFFGFWFLGIAPGAFSRDVLRSVFVCFSGEQGPLNSCLFSSHSWMMTFPRVETSTVKTRNYFWPDHDIYWFCVATIAAETLPPKINHPIALAASAASLERLH